jgi:hypothetical protein
MEKYGDAEKVLTRALSIVEQGRERKKKKQRKRRKGLMMNDFCFFFSFFGVWLQSLKEIITRRECCETTWES